MPSLISRGRSALQEYRKAFFLCSLSNICQAPIWFLVPILPGCAGSLAHLVRLRFGAILINQLNGFLRFRIKSANVFGADSTVVDLPSALVPLQEGILMINPVSSLSTLLVRSMTKNVWVRTATSTQDPISSFSPLIPLLRGLPYKLPCQVVGISLPKLHATFPFPHNAYIGSRKSTIPRSI